MGNDGVCARLRRRGAGGNAWFVAIVNERAILLPSSLLPSVFSFAAAVPTACRYAFFTLSPSLLLLRFLAMNAAW